MVPWSPAVFGEFGFDQYAVEFRQFAFFHFFEHDSLAVVPAEAEAAAAVGFGEVGHVAFALDDAGSVGYLLDGPQEHAAVDGDLARDDVLLFVVLKVCHCISVFCI